MVLAREELQACEVVSVLVVIYGGRGESWWRRSKAVWAVAHGDEGVCI
jgi:hypothetical protein